MSEKLDEFLENSTGIIMAYNEIHNKIPEIEKLDEKLTANYNIYEQELSKIYDNNLKELKNAENNILEFGNSAQNIKTELTDFYNKYQKELSETFERSLNIFKTAENKLQETLKIQSEISAIKNDIDKKLQQLRENNFNNSQTIDIELLVDYTQPHTIQYLFDKYHNSEIPVIVRKIESTPTSESVWSDNYCFWVKDIKNGKAIGSYYHKGSLIESSNSTPSIKANVYALYGVLDEIKSITSR